MLARRVLHRAQPYVIPRGPGVTTESLLTVGDQVSGQAFVGVPDGLGIIPGTRTTTLYVNHEIPAGAGVVRAHGQTGSFVTKLKVNRADHRVVSSQDLITSVSYYDYATGQPSATPSAGQSADFSRFCSGTMVESGRFYNSHNGRGTYAPIYFANEENGAEGRTFGVTPNGTATQLPRLGLLSWENTVAAANQSDTTMVIGNEDGNPGEIHVYVGAKKSRGSALDRAGLTNGSLFALKVPGIADDAAFRAAHDKGDSVAFGLADVNWNQSGAAQQAQEQAAGVLGFNRIEDGHFDPDHPNDYYFLTTDGGEGATNVGGGGGLWRMRFTDVERPYLGGQLTLLLDGTEMGADGLNKPDNMAIDTHGNLLIQEDPGGNAVVARIFAYQIATGRLAEVATFDPERFTPGKPGFITDDEESSGIIDVEAQFGTGAFLFDAQVHTANGLPPGTGPGTAQELVERGQLLLLRVPGLRRSVRPVATEPCGGGDPGRHPSGIPTVAACATACGQRAGATRSDHSAALLVAITR